MALQNEALDGNKHTQLDAIAYEIQIDYDRRRNFSCAGAGFSPMIARQCCFTGAAVFVFPETDECFDRHGSDR